MLRAALRSRRRLAPRLARPISVAELRATVAELEVRLSPRDAWVPGDCDFRCAPQEVKADKTRWAQYGSADRPIAGPTGAVQEILRRHFDALRSDVEGATSFVSVLTGQVRFAPLAFAAPPALSRSTRPAVAFVLRLQRRCRGRGPGRRRCENCGRVAPRVWCWTRRSLTSSLCGTRHACEGRAIGNPDARQRC